MLITGVSVHGAAQASAAGPSLPDRAFAPEVALDAPQARAATEPAQWCALHEAPPCEAPPCEVAALEPEPNEDPDGPDASIAIRPVLGCAATVTSPGQAPQATSETYSLRFAGSLVLATGPPPGTR